MPHPYPLQRWGSRKWIWELDWRTLLKLKNFSKVWFYLGARQISKFFFNLSIKRNIYGTGNLITINYPYKYKVIRFGLITIYCIILRLKKIGNLSYTLPFWWNVNRSNLLLILRNENTIRKDRILLFLTYYFFEPYSGLVF